MNRALPSIEWDESHRIGIKRIDEGLDIVRVCIGEVIAAIANNAERKVVARLLRMMEHWIENQFADEEALMAGLSYAELDEHRRHHDYFRRRIAEIRGGCEAGREVSRESLSFCVNWLTGHVLAIDRKFGEFFKASAPREYRAPGSGSGFASPGCVTASQASG